MKFSDTATTPAAFLIGLVAFGLCVIIYDPTPLLVDPGAYLDWPLGLLGLGMGLWSASHITRLPYVSKKIIGRVSLWIMLPLLLSFGLPAFRNRMYEEFSFRRGGAKEEVTAFLAEKSESTSRRGRTTYQAGVLNSFFDHKIELRIDKSTFDRIEPYRECVRLLIERAPNGAARLIRPLQWKAGCRSVGRPINT